jgi:hypothetical protein
LKYLGLSLNSVAYSLLFLTNELIGVKFDYSRDYSLITILIYYTYYTKLPIYYTKLLNTGKLDKKMG